VGLYAQEQAQDSILVTSLEDVVVSSGVIDVAKERQTPVALTTVSAQVIADRVGNQEFPEIMNNTPGVYATKQGGGYGDSRITVRGFTQRNTAFLINGQPVNDMENGWVYWSNWQGLTDVASGIQIQRGLGSSSLAVPSVGGTVSIFTRAAEKSQGGKVSLTSGNDNYLKTTVVYNTGTNDKGWSSSFLLSKWSGDGYIYNTSGEGTTYFASVGYNPAGSDHDFNFTVLGAGQWHHQRDVWVSIRDYQNFGKDHKDGIDRRWNSNGGTLNGEEYSMRRNFYNKPLATFNWDWKVNDHITLATSLYGSAGRGGGTGPRGNNFRNSDIDILPFRKDLTSHLENGGKARDENGFIDFDQVVAINKSSTSPYTGPISRYEGKLIGSNGFRDDNVNRATLIRRASMNSHDWVGGIMKLKIDKGGPLRYELGIDLRNYKGYHYRVLNDLMGLDGYYSTGNKNSAGQIIETLVEASPFQDTGIRGPKIDYYNIGYVKWTGFNALVEYSNDDDLSAVLQLGTSSQKFQREDFFDQPGNPLSDEKAISGGYIKAGANYNLSDASNLFFNAGVIERQPNFDAVFPNYANNINEDVENEEITSFELGYGYRSSNFKLSANYYNTTWGNRFVSRGYDFEDGREGTVTFDGIESVHQGLELEMTYYPNADLKLKGMLSVGDWKYTQNFEATVFDDNQEAVGTGTLYTKDVKVGDAGQFVAYVELDYKLSNNLSMDFGVRSVDNLYADYSIEDDSFVEADNDGALKLPAYNVADLGVTYKGDLFGNSFRARLNVNNLFDEVYIAESNSNIHATSSSDTWNGVDTSNYVWFGFGTTWNLSLSYSF
jgi:outer membrane cobalamin receptor